MFFKQYRFRLMESILDGGESGAPPAPAPAAPQAPAPEPSADWTNLYNTLPEDLKGEASLKSFKSFPDAMKSLVNAQRAMGSKINVPDPKTATDEDYRKFYNKIGLPEKIEEYDVNLEGVDDDFLKSFKEEAYKTGVLPKQAKSMLSWINKLGQERMQANESKADVEYTTKVNELKKDWGESFKDNIQKAKIAVTELLGPQAAKDFSAKYGNDPDIIRLLAKSAALFKEDVFINHGAGKFGNMSPSDALAKINDIRGNKEHAYNNENHPANKTAKKEVTDLYKIAYPG